MTTQIPKPMHRFLKVLILTISIPLPMFAQDAEPNEIQEARKALREYEQAGKARRAVEITSAGLLVSEHESGRKIAEAGELSKAREALRKNEKWMAEERERAIDAIPALVVVHRDSRFNIGRIFNIANHEVIRRHIAEAKADIERNAESLTRRSHEALPRLEKALQDLKETGKPLGGMYATVFEADDKFVVAYFDSMSIDHFVCLVSKKDYSPLPTVEAKTWIASNLSQKDLIVE